MMCVVVCRCGLPEFGRRPHVSPLPWYACASCMCVCVCGEGVSAREKKIKMEKPITLFKNLV
jgi:hypothetical protein